MQVTAQRLRRTLAATSVAALLALTAACGSDDGTSGSDSAGSDTGSSSGEAAELSQDEFGQAIMAAMQDAGSFSYTMTTSTEANGSAMETTAQGEVEVDGESSDSSATIDAQGQEMEVLMVDEDTYIKSSGEMDTQGKYFKVGPAAKGIWALMGSQADPTTMLGVYDDPSSFEVVGHEEVDGTDTVHYEIGLSRDAYLKNLGDGSPLAQMGELAAQMVPETVTTEIWVDGDNQVRKTSNSLDVEAGGQKMTTSTEMELTDYGTDFDIEAPADDELTDVDPLAGLTGQN